MAELHLGLFDVKGSIPSDDELRAKNVSIVSSGVDLHAQDVRYLVKPRGRERRRARAKEQGRNHARARERERESRLCPLSVHVE